MSVILESQPGDEIFCLAKFHASPQGQPFSWDTQRTFEVGEVVRFVAREVDPHFADQPGYWKVVFETSDGTRYAAVPAYFVTAETWSGLKRFFARRLLREPRRRSRPA